MEQNRDRRAETHVRCLEGIVEDKAEEAMQVGFNRATR